MHHAYGWIKSEMASLCRGKFSFTKKNKGEINRNKNEQ